MNTSENDSMTAGFFFSIRKLTPHTYKIGLGVLKKYGIQMPI